LGATRAEAEMFMMAAILTGCWFCVCRSESIALRFLPLKS